MTRDRGWPTHSLADLRAAIRAGQVVFTAAARDGFTALGFTEEDACECLCALTKEHFVKSMPDNDRRKGVFHDVYNIVWEDAPVYVKFVRVAPDQPFVVTSFKRNTNVDVI